MNGNIHKEYEDFINNYSDEDDRDDINLTDSLDIEREDDI
jgi:hypothetical protein